MDDAFRSLSLCLRAFYAIVQSVLSHAKLRTWSKTEEKRRSRGKKNQKSAFEIEICHQISFSPFRFAFSYFVNSACFCYWFVFVKELRFLHDISDFLSDIGKNTIIVVATIFACVVFVTNYSIRIRFQFRLKNAFAFKSILVSFHFPVSLICVFSVFNFKYVLWCCCHFAFECSDFCVYVRIAAGCDSHTPCMLYTLYVY